jgi:hypothetical protein
MIFRIETNERTFKCSGKDVKPCRLEAHYSLETLAITANSTMSTKFLSGSLASGKI